MSLWRELAFERLASERCVGPDKRMPLSDAVRRFVRPGMKLDAVSLQARPVAALHELIRQFAGRDPGFELISSSLSGNYLQLVGAGLLRRAIVSFAGEGYPTPGPSPVVARALAQRSLELESWSMLTISQRLLAGALGVPFFATRSLAGSDLGKQLAASGGYAEVEDPFHPGTMQGVVAAYRPDLAFVHAWAADPAGHALCFPPHQENVYGALAAREGVVLTVHRVVDRATVRRCAHLVRIPADRVVAVCEVPYGSHPYGNYAVDLPALRPYANDYPFMKAHREAQESAERYAQWLDEWVLGVPDWPAYLAKLGAERLEALELLARPESWKEELLHHAAELDAAPPVGAVEETIVQAARAIGERVRAGGVRKLLSGVGQAALAAWLASHQLRDEGVEVTLLAETGMVGHEPRPADPFLVNFRNLPTSTQLGDVLETLGLHGCGVENGCLAALGAAQVDRHGNVNSSWGADGRFLVGSGGANDVGSAARELLLVAAQHRRSFVAEVDFVTTPGERVHTVVTSMGRYERRDGELMLTAVFEHRGESVEERVRAIRDRCGWELRVAEPLEQLPAASEEEITLLRLFDPERFFLGKTVAA